MESPNDMPKSRYLRKPKLKRGRKPIYTPAQMRVLRRLLAKTLGDVFRGMARSL